MMRRHVGAIMLVVLGMLLLATLALPASHALAQGVVADDVAKCEDYAGLTHRMAGCIREAITGGADVFFKEIYKYLTNTISVVMTLAVLVYGILLAFGMVEKVGRDTFVLILKLSAVIIFSSSSPFILKTVTSVMDGAMASVVSYAPPSGPADIAGGDFSQNICTLVLIAEQADADPEKPIIAPWLGIDCLVDTVLGIKILKDDGSTPIYNGEWFNKKLKDENKGPARSLAFFFFSGAQTSILGLVMAVVGFFFVYGLLMLIVRVFFTYIAGFMGVTFLVIISPLIIPMVLFKETKQYFDKWVKMLISFALQPIIMMVFIIFSLTAMDLAVYSGNYSIYYAIAGEKSREDGFDLNKYLVDNKIIDKKPFTAVQIKADNPNPVPKGDTDKGGVVNKLLFSKCTPEQIKADPALKKTCSFQYPINFFKNSIDWEKMEEVRDPKPPAAEKPGQQIAREVMSSVFFCAMVVFILNGMLSIVPMVAQDLLGDLLQSPGIGGFGLGKGVGGGDAFTQLRKGISSKVESPLSKLGLR